MSPPEQFAEFVRGASAQLPHTARLLTGDRHRAEDLAQTALVRTYAARGRCRSR